MWWACRSAGGPAAGDHAAAVAVFQGAAQASADLPGRPPGADDLAVAFQPDLAVRLAHQVPAVLLGQKRPQMHSGVAAFDVQMHDHGGVLPMRAACHVGCPTRPPPRSSTHPRRSGTAAPAPTGPRGSHRAGPRRTPRRRIRYRCRYQSSPCAVALPLRDQRVTMRIHRGVELRGLQLRQRDPVRRVRLADGLADRPLRLRLPVRFGTRLQLDRQNAAGSPWRPRPSWA